MADRASAARGGREHAEDVGSQLRARREAVQLSLRELARRLEISPSALSQIETGKSRPSVSTLYAIVSELGLSLDQLLGGVGAPGDAPPSAAKTSRSPPRAGRHQPEVARARELGP